MKEELLEIIKKEYKHENKFMTDDQKVLTAITNHLSEINEEDTNKIYVYCGATTRGGYFNHLVDRNDPEAEYLLYWDIEQTYMINIPIQNCEEFESNNTIVYGKHHDVSFDFFKEAIKSDQEKAKKKIIKKYTK